MKKRLIATAQWIARYPWVLVVCALAYGAGAATMLDFGFKLPDAAANVMGAAIGAIAGVGGALAVVLASDYLQGRNLAEYVVFSYSRVAYALGYLHGIMEALDERLGENWDVEGWSSIMKSAKNVVREIDIAQTRIRRVEQNVHRLRADALHLSNLLEKSAADTKVEVQFVIDNLDDARRFYGGKLDKNTRSRISKITVELLDSIQDLKRIYGLPVEEKDMKHRELLRHVKQ